MISNKLNEISERAADRYSQLIVVWQGLYQRYANSSEFGSIRNLSRLSEEAYAIARDFLAKEGLTLNAAIEEIASDARRDALAQLQSNDESEETALAGELLMLTDSYLAREIAIQIERDISLLTESMRKMTLQVVQSARIQGVSIRQALIQHRITHSEPVQFFFYARNAAKWPSRRFVRTLWRHTLLSVYNEMMMTILVDHGEFQAQVDHPNTDFHAQGRVISLFDGSNLPTYLDVRNELFHPNSDAVLRRVA
jgi:hypothetical protein